MFVNIEQMMHYEYILIGHVHRVFFAPRAWKLPMNNDAVSHCCFMLNKSVNFFEPLQASKILLPYLSDKIEQL